jgi:arginyl-tRNA synthetase
MKTDQLTADMLTDWMRSAFSAAFPQLTDLSAITVVPSANPDFGDYQCNAVMALAKAMQLKPRDMAQAVIGQPLHPSLEKMDIAGPGFINLRLAPQWLAGRVVEMAASATLGVPAMGAGKTVILDYSSPNVAKPMHIGHIRSTIIGNSLDRMFRLMGYRVIADNHIGDWGTQFGILTMGYRHFIDKAALDESPVEELERIYVKSYEQSRADETWMDSCRQELVKLQAGDPENRALWQMFVQVSLKEFDHIYRRLDVKFDMVRGESYYHDMLKDIVDDLEKRGLARESEGATVVFLDDLGLPPCIVRKKDGGFNYAATDLATVATRIREFSPDRIVYVTDERQQLHFRQVFATCRKMGLEARVEHIWFGLMRLPEGVFSTRQGNVIKLERLLDEAESRALAIVQQTSPEMPPARQKDVARAVGIGAVKYADLSQNPQTAVTFTWDKALALDGNSGPYLQYAHARIASVIDKYAAQFPGKNPADYPLQFTEPIERTLAMKITRFPEAVVKAAESYKPSTMADYLYDLAQTYSTFYQNVPFLKASEGIRESRMRLCGAVAKTLRGGLALLGIETPDRI